MSSSMANVITIIVRRCGATSSMLVYSVDGFIADRDGAFGWTAPSEEQFRFHIARALIVICGARDCGSRRRSL